MSYTVDEIVKLYQSGLITHNEAREMIESKQPGEKVAITEALKAFSAQLPKMTWETAINKTEAMKFFKE